MSNQQPNRLATGGHISRDSTLNFSFDGRTYHGHPGDTLASALLANGVHLVARSYKYHRRRGIYSAGPEEPNALVQLRVGAQTEPNSRATMVELFDGLVCASQNAWPSLQFDWRAVNQWFSALLPAGFYYKTFMSPPSLWMFYERQIRKAAGSGLAPTQNDQDQYAYEYAHCDVLVVGSGPAGLSAALAAGRAGARVVLADERAELGGSLLWETDLIAGQTATAWAARTIAELSTMRNVRLLPRTTATGSYDHGLVALVERVTDHLPQSPAHVPRQRLIHLRTGHIVLAAGSIERPIVFGDNDKPGVMLASAIRTYINQFAVLPGRRIVLFTNNNDAYRTALDAMRAGAQTVTVVDSRVTVSPAILDEAGSAGVTVMTNACVSAVKGKQVESVEVRARNAAGVTRIQCDLLGSSGGWAPTVHLYSQSGGKLRYDDGLCAFVPLSCPANIIVAGAANGEFTLSGALTEGFEAGLRAAGSGGFTSDSTLGLDFASSVVPRVALAIEPFWAVPAELSRAKRFVDIQDDVSVEDIELAHRENYQSVEHLKRYTALGMGTDQGKTSNVNGLAIMAALRGEAIPAVGTTTFRAPYTPAALGLFVGEHTGKHHTPVRRTPLHQWHLDNGAVMTTVGHWMRPKTYPRRGESYDAAWRRECQAVRERVGLVDVGTLGKIDVQGPDALEFLQRIYCNNLTTLGVGKVRYGLMLREDGIVMDDGTVARLAEDHFVITTTTANAGKVQSTLEWSLQVAWPELKCHALSVTEQFAQFALAGPRSRDVLAALLPEFDVSDAGLPHLGILQATVEGTPVTVFRMSYSGERAYEISVGADCGQALWARLLACGKAFDITPYGTEAMGVLRIEKGHVAGGELDGRMTAADLGLGKLVRKGGGFVGAALARREALVDPKRPALVGLEPADGKTPIRAGSQLVATEVEARAGGVVAKQGFVTSATPSPLLGHPIALAFLENGPARHGQEIVAASPISNEYVRVRIVSPVFHDPDNSKMKG